jgi:hypothetical protein
MATMNLKYGFNEHTGQQAQLPGGINHDVELSGISFEELCSGNPLKVLKFNFKKGDATFRHIEFPVDAETIAKWNFRNSTFEETLKRKFREQGERLKHIYTAITGNFNVKLEAEDWEDFSTKYISLIGNEFQDKRFSIKIVYTDKGYPSFPDRAISPFIVPADKSQLLRIDPQRDRVALVDKQDDPNHESVPSDLDESNEWVPSAITEDVDF